jgi:hypothetical protein
MRRSTVSLRTNPQGGSDACLGIQELIQQRPETRTPTMRAQPVI